MKKFGSLRIRIPLLLDCDALELRKHGVLIRLQEQPLRILAMDLIVSEACDSQINENSV